MTWEKQETTDSRPSFHCHPRRNFAPSDFSQRQDKNRKKKKPSPTRSSLFRSAPWSILQWCIFLVVLRNLGPELSSLFLRHARPSVSSHRTKCQWLVLWSEVFELPFFRHIFAFDLKTYLLFRNFAIVKAFCRLRFFLDGCRFPVFYPRYLLWSVIFPYSLILADPFSRLFVSDLLPSFSLILPNFFVIFTS